LIGPSTQPTGDTEDDGHDGDLDGSGPAVG
jgi:hypothetical protein